MALDHQAFPILSCENMRETSTTLNLIVDEARAGARLDVAIATMSQGISRSKAQEMIKAGLVLVDGRKRPRGFRLLAGQTITVTLPSKKCVEPLPCPELDILYEDDSVLVINKRPGIVVHPGVGHQSGTIVDALKASGRSLSSIAGPERAGLVHRLDRDTSGVLLVAKDDAAHESLSRQFKERVVKKTYLALVLGASIASRGTITTGYGRRASDRKQFTSRLSTGRQAVTDYEVRLRGALCALLFVWPRTGRTHQIRVHLAEHGHPIVGDRVYGRAFPKAGSKPEVEAQALRTINRQALHAFAIRFFHPKSARPVEVIAPLPKDIEQVCRAIFGDAFEGMLLDPFR